MVMEWRWTSHEISSRNGLGKQTQTWEIKDRGGAVKHRQTAFRALVSNKKPAPSRDERQLEWNGRDRLLGLDQPEEVTSRTTRWQVRLSHEHLTISADLC